MPPFVWSVADTNSILDGYDRRRRARDMVRAQLAYRPAQPTIRPLAAGENPYLKELSDRMSALRGAYPWLPSGVVTSLAQAGKGVRSPETSAAVVATLPKLARAGRMIADGIGYEDAFTQAGLDARVQIQNPAQVAHSLSHTVKEAQAKATFQAYKDTLQARYGESATYANFRSDVRERNRFDRQHGLADEQQTPAEYIAWQATHKQPQSDVGAFFSAVTEGPKAALGLYGAAKEQVQQTQTPIQQDVAAATAGGIKGVTRGVGVALQAPYEAWNAVERSSPWSIQRIVAGQTQGSPLNTITTLGDRGGEIAAQTTAGQAVHALITGTKVDLGTGFLPDPASAVGRAQAAASKRALSVSGEASTYGRSFATFVGADPGTTEYNALSGLVDAAAMIGVPGTPFKGFDLANLALGGLGKVGEASKTFRAPSVADAGGVTSLRKLVLGPTAEQWLASPGASALKSNLVAETSPSEIASILGPDFPKVSAYGDNVMADLARADSPEAVDAVLKKVLGITYDKIPKTAGFGYTMRRATQDVRALGLVPERTSDPADLEDFITGAERAMLNAKVSPERKKEILDSIYSTAANDGLTVKVDRYNAFKAVTDVTADALRGAGMPEDAVMRITKGFRRKLDEAHSVYGRAAADGELNIPGFVDGEGRSVDFTQHPLTLAHGLASKVEWPDYREVRKATSFWAPILTNPAVEATDELVNAYMAKWRLGVLLKPNLPLRVLSEETMRMAADGLTSMANHPLSAIGIALGGRPEHPWITGLLSKGGRFTQPMAEALAAGRGADLQALKSASRAEAERRLTQVAGSGEVVARATEKDIAALAQSIYREKLANKTVAGLGRYVADAAGHPLDPDGFDIAARNHYGEALYQNWSALVPDLHRLGIGDWTRIAANDEGWSRGMVTELLQAREPVTRAVVNSTSPEAAKAWFWSGEGKYWREGLAKNPMLAPLAENRQAADAYIDTLYGQVKDLTHDDPELLDAIRTGKFRGEPLADRYGTPNSKVIKELDALKETDWAPAQGLVKSERTIAVAKNQNTKLDQALQSLFFNLMPRPSNYLNRSPAFRQYYWDTRVPKLAPYLAPDDWEKLLANARDARVSDATYSRLERIRQTSTTTTAHPNVLSLAQLDEAAKGMALTDTRKLLYYLGERRQYSDMMRNIFPFLEAWKEVIGRWMTLARKNPAILRTAQRDIAGLRNAGVFHTDPTTGQEVYSIPATGWLTDNLIGVPIPLSGSASGLNIASGGLPGVGPVVQVPAAYLLPDNPDFDWLHKVIFPFGSFKKSGSPLLDIVNAALPIPNWLRRASDALTDPDQYRNQINTTGHIMRYLASTGDYALNGQGGKDPAAEMRRLVSDAKEKATYFGFIRALALAGAPSAPTPEYQVKDKQGNVVLAQRLADDYQKMLDHAHGDSDQALAEYIRKYGTDNLLTLQAFSEPVKGYLPPTKKALDWARRNGDAREKHPEVYGYFAPGQNAEFDIDAFGRSFDRGERQPIKPEDMVKAANSRIASYLYRKAQAKATDSPADQAWLDQVKAALTHDYPGYNEHAGDYLEIPTQIRKISEAVKDPALARTDAGRAAKQYLKARDQALAQADGGALSGANDAHLRDWLRQVGEALVREHPNFQSMFTYVFSSELRG